MAAQFQVGNLVILQNATTFLEYNGFLAVITDLGRYRRAMNSITMKREWHYSYKVKVIKALDELSVDNGQLCVRPWQIRPLSDANDQELFNDATHPTKKSRSPVL
jgi:hypothetical protein